MDTLQHPTLSLEASQTALLADYLNSEGFPASIDSDGDIIFKSEGLDYALCFDRKDANFAKLILPNIWEINEQAELHQALIQLDNINRKLKVVKGHTVKDTVWLTVEFFYNDGAQITFFVKRMILLLAHAAMVFARGMESDKEQLIELASRS